MSKTKKELLETIADLEADLAGCEATIEELEAESDELRVKARELSRAYDEIDHRGADQGETLIEYIRRVSSSVQIHKDMIAAQERSQAELREDVDRLETELHHANGLLTRRKTEIDELKASIVELAEIEDMLDSAGADSGPSTINRVEDLLVSLHSCITLDDHSELLEVKDRYIQQLRDELNASQHEARHWSRTTTSLQDSLEEMHDKYMNLLDMQSRRGLARRAISRVLEVVL